MSRVATLSTPLLGALVLAPLAFSSTARAEPDPVTASSKTAPEGAPEAASVLPQTPAESVESPVHPPPGFERVRTHPFGIAGGGALGQGYTLSALIATGALLICAGSSDGGRGCDMKPSPGAFRELYIPLAGPWLALRRDDVHGDTKYALLFGGLGVVQGVGLLLVAYDLLVPRYTVQQVGSLSVGVVANSDAGLLTLNGRF